MRKFFMPIVLGLLLGMMSSCMDANKGLGGTNSESTAGSLYIVNSGIPSFDNSSLSIYNPKAKEVKNQVFYNTNGQKLGDMAYSISAHSSLVWIVVSSSDKIYAVDPVTAYIKGTISGFSNPRHIHFVGANKAYVTQKDSPRINIVNPQTYSTTGYIELKSEGASFSTEQMAQVDGFLYVTCWSGQETVLKINTQTDEVVGMLTVGLQPRWITVDKNKKLWVLTDGGDQDGKNVEYPRLVRIDPNTFTIERTFYMNDYEEPHSLTLNRYKDTLFWITAEGIWKMGISEDQLPVLQYIEGHKKNYLSMLIDHTSDEIYIADGADGNMAGRIHRFTSSGDKVDEFTVGINPSAFCLQHQ